MRNNLPEIIPSARIPGTRLPKPTNDFVFKRLMQSNLTALKSLLTAVLQPQSPIESITLLPTELHGTHLTSKESRLDLLVKLHNGTLIDIEVQSSREAHFVRRSLYYTFQMMGSTLSKGDSYENLPSLAGIYIFDDVVFPSLAEVHSSFQLRRSIPDDGFHLQPKLLRLDFIELPKISSLNPEENPLFSAWVQFLAANSAEDIECAAHSIPEINQLVGELNKMSADKEFIDLLNKNEVDRIIAQRTNAQALRDARDEGKAEGKSEGIAQGKAEGERQALLNSIQIILSKKMNITKDVLLNRLSHRSISELESLLSAALDFASPADLEAWENSHPTQRP